MTRPLVSVCVLVYNHEQYIKQCLDSILNQHTDFEWELIISDDYSTDNSRRIIERFKNLHPEKISLLYSQTNKGVIRSLQKLLKAARGKYIAFCEGDDYWTDDEKLQKQFSVLERNEDISMVFTNRKILKADGSVLVDSAYTKEIYTIDDVIEGFIPGTQTIMMRNYISIGDFFEKYKSVYSGDRYMAYFCSLFGNIYFINEITAVYRDSGHGVWSKFQPAEKLMILRTQMIEFHRSLGIPTGNIVLAERSFLDSVNIFLYCLKRPGLFFSENYRRFIWLPFKEFSKMNRIKLLCKAITARLKKS